MSWSRETVAARIRESWDTLRRMPAGKVQGFRTSWPQYVNDAAEAYGYGEVIVRLSPASPQAIDRMHETFGWFVCLADRPHLTKAMWLTSGMGMGPKRAGLIIGAHRDTIRQRRDEALDLLADGLNGQKPPSSAAASRRRGGGQSTTSPTHSVPPPTPR